MVSGSVTGETAGPVPNFDINTNVTIERTLKLSE
jgi:hypothetical protein